MDLSQNTPYARIGLLARFIEIYGMQVRRLTKGKPRCIVMKILFISAMDI